MGIIFDSDRRDTGDSSGDDATMEPEKVSPRRKDGPTAVRITLRWPSWIAGIQPRIHVALRHCKESCQRASQTPAMTSLLSAIKSPLFRKIAVPFVSLLVALSFILVLLRLDAGNSLVRLGKQTFGKKPIIVTCESRNQTWGPISLREAEARYADLLDDKFTYVSDAVSPLRCSRDMEC